MSPALSFWMSTSQMDFQHFNPGQEGTPASVIPEETGESPSGSQISGSAELLRLHHREHQLHHSMSTDWKAPLRVVKTVQRITATPLPAIEAVQHSSVCGGRVVSSGTPLTLVTDSGRRYRNPGTAGSGTASSPQLSTC